MAAPQARRELELRLKITTDAVPAKAGMDQLAQSAERAQRAASKAQRASGWPAGAPSTAAGRAVYGTPEFDARTGKYYGNVGGVFGRGGLAGRFEGAGEAIAGRLGISPGMAGPAAAALVAAQAARTGKATADAYRDELLTEGQRARRIVGSVPFGETALGFLGTITGRDRDMARAQEEGQLNAVRSSAESQIYTTQLSLRGGVAQSRAQANALRGAQAERTPNIDRASAEGERRYRLESQLTALRERGATAGRAAAAAREEESDAAKSLADIERRMNANRQRQAEVQRAIDRQAGGDRSTGRRSVTAGILGAITSAPGALIGGFGREALDESGPARKRYLDEQARLQDELTALSGNRATQIQQRAGAAQRAVQAEAERQRANGPEQMRARAAELEERAGRAMSASERIGLSTPESAEEGYAALQNIVAGGIDSADPSEIAAAQRFAPETVARLAQQSGRRNPMYDAFRQLADPGEYPTEGAGGLLRRANDLKNQAGQSDINIQAQAAERGAAMAAATMDAYIAALRANIPNLIERAKNEILQGRSASAGSQ